MKLSTKLALVAAILVSISTGVHAGSDNVLTDKAGMTLYTFDKDSNGESVCYGGCAKKWPPFIASADANAKSGWGMTTRKDGSKQWTFNDQPLYTWVGDNKKGDTTGDGVGDVWHTAKRSKAGGYKKSSSYSSSIY